MTPHLPTDWPRAEAEILYKGRRHRVTIEADAPEILRRCREDAVEVAVADEGVGIPASERERIFAKFYKAGGGQGTGLGLFIAQGLVREMGGKIRVDSEEGHGSRFAFELPVVREESV